MTLDTQMTLALLQELLLALRANDAETSRDGWLSVLKNLEGKSLLS